ncbi:MAG: hypothetical protein KAJ19_15485 [Gammaproteobacteria bacterium]|nr:hypothetical protein [Gammaproteobacteria bacterium]
MYQTKQQDIIDAINRTNARIRDLQQQKEFIDKLIVTNSKSKAKLEAQLNEVRLEILSQRFKKRK